MIGIGPKKAPQDAVDKLVDCHERIRKFSSMAVRLAGASDAADADVADAAERVRRYFTEALPKHAIDEDESIEPRLRGLDPAVDTELDEMAREHRAHEAPIAKLVELCEALAADPSRLAALKGELSSVAEEVATGFVAHLAREEEVIFPAMRRLLDRDAMEAISEEMAARRDRA